MSQSIRICSGFSGPVLQHIPNTTTTSSSSCMEVISFPIDLSVKECRKRAMVVSNRNHSRRSFPCTATLKSSNVDLDDESGTGTGSSSKGNKYDDPLKIVLSMFSQTWRAFLLMFRSGYPEQVPWFHSRYLDKVNKEVVVMMILRDCHDPIDGLKVLLDVSRAWRTVLSLGGVSQELLSDGAKVFDDYVESFLQKARMKGVTNKGKHNPSWRITTRLSILRLLADLNDPIDGLQVMLGALEIWSKLFLSKELNDSEGYLQKEIFAIRNLFKGSQILVSNCSGIHDEMKNPPLKITHVLKLLKLLIKIFKHPSDAGNTVLESLRYHDETSGLLVVVVAKLNFDDNDDCL